MRDPRGEPQQLRGLLDAAGRRLGVKTALGTGAIWRNWSDIVGPQIAAHAEPTSLRDGILRVRTESPTWATEVGYLAPQIRSRANVAAAAEVVERVVVWTGPGAIRGAATEAAREAAAPVRESIGGDSRPRSEDPKRAFEAARRAWSKRRGRHH